MYDEVTSKVHEKRCQTALAPGRTVTRVSACAGRAARRPAAAGAVS